MTAHTNEAGNNKKGCDEEADPEVPETFQIAAENAPPCALAQPPRSMLANSHGPALTRKMAMASLTAPC